MFGNDVPPAYVKCAEYKQHTGLTDGIELTYGYIQSCAGSLINARKQRAVVALISPWVRCRVFIFVSLFENASIYTDHAHVVAVKVKPAQSIK